MRAKLGMSRRVKAVSGKAETGAVLAREVPDLLKLAMSIHPLA